jgi:hypothetical protein
MINISGMGGRFLTVAQRDMIRIPAKIWRFLARHIPTGRFVIPNELAGRIRNEGSPLITVII